MYICMHNHGNLTILLSGKKRKCIIIVNQYDHCSKTPVSMPYSIARKRYIFFIGWIYILLFLWNVKRFKYKFFEDKSIMCLMIDSLAFWFVQFLMENNVEDLVFYIVSLLTNDSTPHVHPEQYNVNLRTMHCGTIHNIPIYLFFMIHRTQ